MARATENTSAYTEIPIWADYDLSIPIDTEYVSYHVVIGGEVVYNGHAYSADGANAVIRVNHIIRDYLSSTIDFDTVGIQNNGAYITATIMLSYDDWATSLQYMMVRAYYDYSYEYQETQILSDPIIKILDPRQKFLCSIINTYTDNSASPVTYAQGSTLSSYTMDNGVYTIVQDNLSTEDITVETSSGYKITYKMKNTCKPYCLYYLNSRGGWDSMVFEGKVLQKAAVSISQYNSEYDNTSAQFNIIDYMKTKKDQWALTTCFLTDAQSKKMHNIFDTTKAYLHIFDDDKIIPVTVTDTSYDVKTYRNQSRKLFTYTVNVQASQQKQIR